MAALPLGKRTRRAPLALAFRRFFFRWCTVLEERIARMHAALGRTRVTNLARFPARVTNTPRWHGFFQEFRGGASPEDLMNDAFTLIANVACLRDHLKK